MKIITLFILMLLLAACENSSSTNANNDVNLSDFDLTGTWLVSQETKAFRVDTGDYLSSDFIESTYIFEETDQGVKFDKCWDYGGFSSYGVKTNNKFYMNISDNGFNLKSDGSLVQTTDIVTSIQDIIRYENISTLTKISENVVIDNGSYTLNGPVSITENDHVCLWTVDSNLGTQKTIEILVPFDTDTLSLRFDLQDDISPGTYEYTASGYDSPIRVDVGSNSDLFWSQVNSNTLAATNASITVTEYSATVFSGTFTFVGQDLGNYSGEFEVLF